MLDRQKWSSEIVRQVGATPWSLHETQRPDVICSDATPDMRHDKISEARRLYIRKSDLDKYGYMKGCLRCQHILTDGAKDTSVMHIPHCCATALEEMANTPELGIRF